MPWEDDGDDVGEDDGEGVGDGAALLGLDDDDDNACPSGLANNSCMAALSCSIQDQEFIRRCK